MKAARHGVVVGALSLGLSVLGGCQGGVPKEALSLNAESLPRRQLQTRRFDTTDERKLLQAAAGLIQDLGFTIDSTQAGVGLLVASKQRDATDAGQVVGAVLVAALFGVATPVDRDQRIRVSVVTAPKDRATTLRVTFQRVVWNTSGQVTRLEFLAEPQMYEEFFAKLSKAVFLEANQI